MNKSIIALALIGLLFFTTACSTASDVPTTSDEKIAQAAPEVAEAASEVIDTDTVEIGEMI